MRWMIVGGVAAALALSACHKTGSNVTANKASDTAPVNAVQDVTATAVGGASAVTHATTADLYVPAAAMADMYEIEAAKIAVARTKDPAIKAFADMLIKDHTASSEKLKATLGTASLNITPPAGLDDRRTGMLNNLKAAGDADFDLAYLHQQLAAHLEALTLHKEYSSVGDNAGLKAFAASVVPVIEHHLGEVRRLGGDKLKETATP